MLVAWRALVFHRERLPSRHPGGVLAMRRLHIIMIGVAFALLAIACGGGGGLADNGRMGDPEPSTIKNAAGRFVQVDIYDRDGYAIDSLSLSAGDRQQLPAETAKVEIRDTGETARITRPGTRVRIGSDERLQLD